jgi:hypothetical protein
MAVLDAARKQPAGEFTGVSRADCLACVSRNETLERAQPVLAINADSLRLPQSFRNRTQSGVVADIAETALLTPSGGGVHGQALIGPAQNTGANLLGSLPFQR